MKELNSGLAKVFKYAIVVNLALTVLYASNQFYTVGVSQNVKSAVQARSAEEVSIPIPITKTFAEHQFVWTTADGRSTDIPEGHVVSKLFSDTLGTPKIMPFFFRAEGVVNAQDITIATLVTGDRFPVLSRLASHYQGPISAAIHINDNDKDDILKQLRDAYAANPDMQKHVDVHVILDRYERQFNMWRNIAKLFMRTDFLTMLDVDFYLCTDFRNSILSNRDILAKLGSGNTALVIPAFEYVNHKDGFDSSRFPRNKRDLLEIIPDKIDMFHKLWSRGHGSTNYSRWHDAEEIYKVDEYNHSYEPYIVFKKDESPWCDERFIGYGANKAACLYELYLSGVDYYVLPNDFLIHQNHDYPEKERTRERRYNRKIYDNFREEVCLRYARRFIADGIWNTSKADNLKSQCSKIRNFGKTLEFLL
ncbi:hypothetical protein BZG36_03542 [Bifiguratus adelaidae]|uniref:Glycosyltransferase family 49 protein n=1 Tax=Bifiguratus adelaidae TaxID=1938954 RepID=A0A261XZ65_9FUNG|nr:hypothetical protein BZG36_03542 [Bifiguratus adelaidae]